MKRLLKLLRPFTIHLIFSVILALGYVVCTLLLPVWSGKAVDTIVGKGNVDFDSLKQIAGFMIILIGGAMVCQWGMNLLNNKVCYGLVKTLRQQAFSKLTKIPISDIDSHSHGDYVSRIISDSDTIADGLLLGFSTIFTGVVTIIGTIIMMIRMNFIIALIVIVLTPVSIFMARAISKNTYKYFMTQSKDRADITEFISEMTEQGELVRSLDISEKVKEDFEEKNKTLTGSSLKATFISSLTNPSSRAVNSLIYIAVIVAGAYAVITGKMSVGELSAFLGYTREYSRPFNDITGVLTELSGAFACAERVFELIDMEDEPDGELTFDGKFEGNIKFEDVFFSYKKDQKLIENLDLDVNAGQKIAIVGPTGAGKTTMINLVMRFYDVTGGAIKIDGIDVKELKRHELRDKIGMVLQETWLFSGTIRENLLISNPGISEEEMINAAKAAHAHSFIKKLPKGYDTLLEEDGGALSQGQKQLLCIARLMIALPPMLILDEATSSIDTRTEMKIQDAFSTMMKGRTTFIVAHRLRTIMNADIILYMEGGRVLESGTHSQLLKKGGKYAALYRSQFL
ncbi:MAG: ABC transporter ATP-binding protein/permease [Lachnospiraceae bacterium]|nr:ABC transporter ATP-binding protein/permease [Lachnospiraceae bacterium]